LAASFAFVGDARQVRSVRLSLALVLTLAEPASARPLVDIAVAIDIDGDGLPDTATVAEGGRLRVVLGASAAAGGTLPDLPLMLAPWRDATFTTHVVDTHRILSVRGMSESGTEVAALFEWHKGALLPVWDGPVGPQGRDGEWRRHVEIGPDGIVRYEETPGVTRCDGVPAVLNAQRYDFDARAFVAVGPARAPPADQGTPILLFQREAPPGLSRETPPRVFRFQAASTTEHDGGSAAELSPPRELDDDNPKTAWAEARAGNGAGTFLTARNVTARSALVRALRVLPGDASSRRAFLAANRIKRVRVLAGTTHAFLVDMPEDPASEASRFAQPYWVVFPKPLAASCVTVVVETTYPGSRADAGGRTAISELVVLTHLDGGSDAALAALAETVATGGVGASEAEAVLTTYGPSGAQALLGVVRKPEGTEAQKRRARLALARLADPLGAEEVALGLRADLPEGERQVYQEALLRLGEAAAPALVALLGDEHAALPTRVLAASLLGHTQGPPAREALARHLGHVAQPLRRACAVALGGRSTVELALVEAALTAEAASEVSLREAGLWHAARLLARRSSQEAQDAIVRSAARRLQVLAVAKAPTDPAHRTHARFELRYRLVEVLALRPSLPEASARLTELLRAEPEPVVRLAAIKDLGGPEAAPFLIQALADADPGVRLEAALRLAESADTAVDTARLERLRADAWPMVRKAVAGSLGASCHRKAPADALLEAAASDPDDDVRRAALTALTECEEPRVASVLLALLGDTHAAVSLRAHAALLLGELGDPRHATSLVARLAVLHKEAAQRESALRIAVAATRALGKLDHPAALSALLAAVADATFPAVQAAAADALAQRCPAGSRAALERAEHSQDAVVVRAARLALKVCAR
jgi:HEAT repeat protein